jgi:hypothetical protein
MLSQIPSTVEKTLQQTVDTLNQNEDIQKREKMIVPVKEDSQDAGDKEGS